MNDESASKDVERAGLLGTGLIGSAGAAVSASHPALGPLIAAASPVLGVALGGAVRRSLGVLETAKEYAGYDDYDEFGEALEANEDAQVLCQDVLTAAQRTTYKAKLNALSRCLANALTDASMVDDERLVVQTISDLEPMHVRALARFATRSEDADENDGTGIFTAQSLANHDPGFAHVVAPVVAVLVRTGLVIEGANGVTWDGAQPGVITKYGRSILARLQEEDTGESPAS